MGNLENLCHYTPTQEQYERFEQIQKMSNEEQERICCLTNDCSICEMAIHQFLLSTIKHTCVYGMTKEKFEIALDNADCEF